MITCYPLAACSDAGDKEDLGLANDPMYAWRSSRMMIIHATLTLCAAKALEARDPVEHRPFGDGVGTGRQASRLPLRVQEVGVGKIFNLAAGRITEIPEIGRRHFVAARSHDGFPTVLGEMQTATEHLMNIAYFERDVLELRALVTRGQQRHIVMITFRSTAAEEARPGIAVRGRELQAIQIEILPLRQVVRARHFEYDMANACRLSARVMNSRLIDAFAAAHEIDLGRSGIDVVGRLHARVRPQLETDSVSERIEAMDRVIGGMLDRAITR